MNSISFTREEFIKLVTGDDYNRMPFYKTFKAIQYENPEMSVEDILVKYFDPFKGSFVHIEKDLDDKDIPYRRIYESKLISKDDQLVAETHNFSCDKNVYLIYREYRHDIIHYESNFYKIREEEQFLFNPYISVGNKLELISGIRGEEKDPYLAYIISKNPTLETLGLAYEYGYTKDEILKAVVGWGKHNKVYNNNKGCCYMYYSDKLGEFRSYGPCKYCNATLVIKNASSYCFVSTDPDDIIPEPCIGCTKPCLSFILDKDGNKTYCHYRCRTHKISVYNIGDLIVYNNSMVQAFNETDNIFDVIFESDE